MKKIKTFFWSFLIGVFYGTTCFANPIAIQEPGPSQLPRPTPTPVSTNPFITWLEKPQNCALAVILVVLLIVAIKVAINEEKKK